MFNDDEVMPGGREVPGELLCVRSERRDRIVIAVGSAVAAVSVVVVLCRVSPGVVTAIAGRSQVGKALRGCR